jgi:hypothetical protein
LIKSFFFNHWHFKAKKNPYQLNDEDLIESETSSDQRKATSRGLSRTRTYGCKTKNPHQMNDEDLIESETSSD